MIAKITAHLIDLCTTRTADREQSKRIPSAVGLKALEVARSEIGHGETVANNQGDEIDRYRGGSKQVGAWCAAFVFFCFMSSAWRLKRKLGIARTHGARKLFNRAVKQGWLVDLEDICPGDMVLWSRGPDGSWKAHIGIVSRVAHDANGKVTQFWYIAGNEGGFPSKVREVLGTHKKRRVGFARVR